MPDFGSDTAEASAALGELQSGSSAELELGHCQMVKAGLEIQLLAVASAGAEIRSAAPA